MKLLALDTSTEACSVALQHDAQVFSEFALTPREHTKLILPMLESVLHKANTNLADIDALVVGQGPGAFTGIRIGIGVAQGIAMAMDKPIIPISTLAALAQQAYQEYGAMQVLAALDARMGEVYWGQYVLLDGLMRLQGDELVCKPYETPVPEGNNWFAVGHGWSAYAAVLNARFSSTVDVINVDLLPAAEFMLPLAQADWRVGKAVAPELAQPVYLRNKIALTTQERAAQHTL